MKARDLMSRNVQTVSPSTPVVEIAAAMDRHRISAVPVVTGENEVVGIVSESDLIRRPETGTERRRSWWLELITDPDTKAREYVKTHGMHAADIMARPVISVTEEAELADIADVFEQNRIKRVPVLRQGKLVGIVSRADLVRALVRSQVAGPAAAPGDDASLQKRLQDRMRADSTVNWLDTVYVNSTVHNGVVELWGFVRSEDQRRALQVLAENVPGVVTVESHLQVGPPAAMAW